MIATYSVGTAQLALLLSFAAAPGMAVEREVDGLDDLRLGIRLVEEGDYAAAIDVLEAAAIELEDERAEPRDMAQSYFYAGVARVFIVGEDEARFAFTEARRYDPEFEPAETEFPRRVIRLWEEASVMNATSDSAVGGGGPTGTLTVTTQPAGATVYVAGRPRGETPVEIAGLRSGDHRVTIVRDGYVNNSRIMPLAPDRNELLNVELTPAGGGFGSGSAELQQEAAGGGGGGWWRWAALAGGGGAAALLLLPRNQPPVAGLSVSPSGSGMAGATQYSFDGGSSSDPDNDSLTYSWNFGDGSTGSGVRATHVYSSAGTYSVTLTVSDGKEQATATGTASVARNLDGARLVAESVIRGTSPVIDVIETLSLTQNGSSLSGRFEVELRQGSARARGSTSVSGRISSASNFVCPCDVQLSGGGYTFTGTVDNGANTMRGRARIVISDLGTITGESVYERR